MLGQVWSSQCQTKFGCTSGQVE